MISGFASLPPPPRPIQGSLVPPPIIEKKGSPVAGLDCLMQGVAMAETPLLPFIRSIFSINAPLEKGGRGGCFPWSSVQTSQHIW
jgi:hypothetical protein